MTKTYLTSSYLKMVLLLVLLLLTQPASSTIADFGWYIYTNNPLYGIDVGDNSVPAFVDIDNDEDFDLFIGESGGMIKFYENTGNVIEPNFENKDTANPLNGVNVGNNSNPTFVDIDNDEDFDAFVGNFQGTIHFYKNMGTADQPNFIEQTGNQNPLNGIRVGLNSVPRFVDIDNDEDVDVFIGENAGTIKYYQNTGTAKTPNFVDVEQTSSVNPFGDENFGYPTAPAFVDIDQDHDFDAVIALGGLAAYISDIMSLGNESTLKFYENTGTANHPNFVELFFEDNPFDPVSMGRALYSNSITFVDIDNDGDFDGFTGEGDLTTDLYIEGGTIVYVINVSIVSQALPAGDKYNNVQEVTLQCLRCIRIHYTLDGTEPTMVSTEFKEPFTIPANLTTTVKYLIVDTLGNPSEVTTETYYIDTTPPTIEIKFPEEESSLESLTAIQGIANDPEYSAELDRIEIQVTNGEVYLTKDNSFTTTEQPWLEATGTEEWLYDSQSAPAFPPGIYTLTARAYDKAGNVSEQAIQVKINRAATVLTLNLSHPVILQNATIDVTGEFHRYPLPSDSNLSNLPIRLKSLTAPNHNNNQVLDTVTFYDEKKNKYLFEFKDVYWFTHKGRYTLQAVFKGTELLTEAYSPTNTLLVDTFAGYAILVQGKVSNGEGMESYNKTLNRVYDTLIARGFIKENIRYFNYNTYQERVYGLPTKPVIKETIETWAKERLNGSPAPFYLIMVDHGKHEYFYLGDEFITSQDLNTWLSTMESALTLEALEEFRMVILGTCYSGSFIPALSKPKRVIITSAAGEELSYKGPKEPDGIRGGEYFIEVLFQQLKDGKPFKMAFEKATEETERHVPRNKSVTTSYNPYQDQAVQHPLIDDNGDGEGSNVLYLGMGDGQQIDQPNSIEQPEYKLYLGAGPEKLTNNFLGHLATRSVRQANNAVANLVEIIAVTETLYLNEAESAQLWLKVNDPAQVDRAVMQIRQLEWHEITTESEPDETAQQELDRPQVLLELNADNGRFEGTYDAFKQAGPYEISYYIHDIFGNISPIYRSKVYKNRPGNQAPHSFSLQIPDNETRRQTVLIFDWDSTTDPDNDPITYNLVLGTSNLNNELQSIAYRQEGLTHSMTYIDDSAKVIDEKTSQLQEGLKDHNTYYWRVEAVDNFGAKTVSEIRSFKTDNTSAPMGIQVADVISALNYGPVEHVNIIPPPEVIPPLNVGGLEIASERGRYIFLLQEALGLVKLSLNAPNYRRKIVSTSSQTGRVFQWKVLLQPITTFSLNHNILSMPIVKAGELGKFQAQLQADEQLASFTVTKLAPMSIEHTREYDDDGATFSIETGKLLIPAVELEEMAPTRYQVEMQIVPESNPVQFRLIKVEPLL